MGLGDFFKNIFGKKTCAFCGGECGMMSRTKIKGDEYICSKCDDMCSNFIRKSRFTKPELEGHMEYMKRSDRIYKEVILPNVQKHECYPSATQRQGIEFFDDFGMFRIMDGSRDHKENYPKELFRYDQVASYEPYYEEAEPEEAGKPKVFHEGGIIIRLVGALDDTTKMQKGLRAHPYITEEIKVMDCVFCIFKIIFFFSVVSCKAHLDFFRDVRMSTKSFSHSGRIISTAN